ncbi:hypothetical protein CDAR_412841 [Caerostris darwini]|uniref:Uncharacterized protein n=1 Tax=Caerostris darwini TaxID=1538125 RepID=A0AAV4SIE6_9ARAC|nr:hypothetical protein CDAR_412841 [Caerostris darwini]
MWAIRTSRYRPGLKWLTESPRRGDGDGGFSGSKQKANRVWIFDLLLIADRIPCLLTSVGGKSALRRFFTVEKGTFSWVGCGLTAKCFGIFMSFC